MSIVRKAFNEIISASRAVQTMPREEVLKFADVMEQRLAENDHKGGWGACTNKFLVESARVNLKQAMRLLRAGRKPTMEEVEEAIRALADAANFSMMMADNAERRELK